MIFWVSYYFLKAIVVLFFRGKCYNRDNLPEEGPFIGIINHNSIFDIPAMTLVAKRRAVTMVKHSLFEVPLLGWWLRAVGMFPVHRGESDQAAFDNALHHLKKGYTLFMAPEGTRKYDPKEPPRPHTGFVRLAQLAGCPIVPIAFTGTREVLPPGAKFPRFVQIKANVGKPLKLEKVEVVPENLDKLQQQATEAMKQVYRLRDELLSKYN